MASSPARAGQKLEPGSYELELNSRHWLITDAELQATLVAAGKHERCKVDLTHCEGLLNHEVPHPTWLQSRQGKTFKAALIGIAIAVSGYGGFELGRALK